jgi:hypothetical protein
MPEDQIGQKIVRLTPADMARLPYLIKYKKVFSFKQLSPSAGITLTLNLPCFTSEIIHF